MKTLLLIPLLFLLTLSQAHAASSERLIREVQCNHQANGASQILTEVRTGIPEKVWFDVYPIPATYNEDQIALIQRVVASAYKFTGSGSEFMKKWYDDCMDHKDI